MSERGGDGESVVSESLSLLSYTLRYVSLVDLDRLCQLGVRKPIHLCTCVGEEGGDGEERGGSGGDSGHKNGIIVFRTVSKTGSSSSEPPKYQQPCSAPDTRSKIWFLL